MAVLQGSPKTVISVEDKSIIQTTPISGIVIVQGITNRGEVGGVKFIGNPLQFRRKMGGKRSDDPFSIYCLRMLEAGVKLWVIRAGHYTDINDEDTVEGTKATDNNEVAITKIPNQDVRGEYAMKIQGSKVIYNSYYLKNGEQLVDELKEVFYKLNVEYARTSILSEFKTSNPP